MLRRDFMRLSASAALAGYIAPHTAGMDRPGKSLGREVPWLKEIQQPHKAVSSSPGLPALRVDEDGRAIETLVDWQRKRALIRERWLNFMGPLPENPEPPQPEVIEEDHPTGVIRQLVEYEGEPGRVVRGYLIKPRYHEGPLPGVLTLHSTTDNTIEQPAGVRGAPEKAFGLKLAQLGCVTFSPMNFLWVDKGERSYGEQAERFRKRHPDTKGMAKMLFDASRALDLLQRQSMVDGERLGVMGHSLGAKEALYLAAFDERVKSAVSSEGGISTKFSNWDAPWYLGESIRDFGHDHHELLGLIAPRPFLLVGGDSADGSKSWPFIEEALSVYELYGNPCSIGLFNHEEGHSVPQVAELRSYQWMLNYM